MKKITLVGLPFTGKTTFIAALWHVLESNEITSELVLEKYEGDKKYLNDIRHQWLTFNLVNRTVHSKININNLQIRNSATNCVFEIVIPDLSGEIFELQWSQREWSSEYNNLIKESNSFLVFINPSQYQDSDEIIDINQILPLNQTEALKKEVNTEKCVWNPEKTATQVKLVDLLQMIAFEKLDRINVGVVISAWDLVMKNPEITPEKFLRNCFPLLYQYLYSNSDTITYKIIGLSAQGGEYDKDMDKLNKIKPSERIQVLFSSQKTNDITKCISWFE